MNTESFASRAATGLIAGLLNLARGMEPGLRQPGITRCCHRRRHLPTPGSLAADRRQAWRRAHGTAGYVAVYTQPLLIALFWENHNPRLELDSVAYPYASPDGFVTLQSSGSSDVIAAAEGVDLMRASAEKPDSPGSGCDADDFAGFTVGHIAVPQRGGCDFAQKVYLAGQSRHRGPAPNSSCER